MKVVHVTTLHPPDDVRIWLKECRTLARRGYEVVLAAPVADVSEREGVTVKPVGVTRITAGVTNLAPRLANVFRTVRRERADLYHLHDPELIPVGLALKLTGTAVVFDAHEDTPLDVLTIGAGSGRGVALQARAWRTLESTAGLAFDGIVAATPGIARKFPTRKTVLLRNFPLEEEAAGFDGLPYLERPPEVAYLGQLSSARGVQGLVEAMQSVSVEEATLVLAGRLHPREPGLLEELERTPGWERVRYLGLLDRAGVAEVLGRARAGLALLPPARAYAEALPVKLFEYMSAGLPVIASDFPLWRGIVEPARAGLLVDPTDRVAVASAIDTILRSGEEAEAMGARGRSAFERTYTWETEVRGLLALYDRLLRRT